MMKEKEIMEILCEAEERAIKDITKTLKKDDIPAAEWTVMGSAVDIIKDAETVKAMIESREDMNESEWGMLYPYMNSGEDSYKASRMRSANGRYMNGSKTHGYYTGANSREITPYAGGNYYASEASNVANSIRSLMNSSTNESERAMYKRFLDEAESYNR